MTPGRRHRADGPDHPVQRVVVTGGAGFLGSHLCDRLVQRDIDVLCLDNLVTGSLDNIAHLQGNSGFRLEVVDVSEELHVEGRVDGVFHLASPASPVDYALLPIETLKVGTLGTHRVLELALSKDARVLMASTSEVYGDPAVHPQPEGYWGNVSCTGPRSVYDEAKRAAEAFVMAYRRTHGLETRIARIFNTYGPRMRSNDGRAVPALVSAALAGEPLPVFGDGMQTRSLCYVDDLVDGLERLFFSDYAEPVNIGNQRESTVIELAEIIRTLCESSSQVKHLPLPPDDPRQRCPDTAVAQRVLDWQPAVALEEGLSRTIAWWRGRIAPAS